LVSLQDDNSHDHGDHHGEENGDDMGRPDRDSGVQSHFEEFEKKHEAASGRSNFQHQDGIVLGTCSARSVDIVLGSITPKRPHGYAGNHEHNRENVGHDQE
jgi:hypothetical protein